MTTCTHCNGEVVAKGLCDKHYRRLRRTGSPTGLLRQGSNMTIQERLSLHSKPVESGCIEWQAAKNNDGYGQVKYNGKMRLAHRVAYELANGAIDPELCVMHTCDNPSCINPYHLVLGTHQENMADMARKSRTNPVQGVRHHKAKLTESDVLAIRSDSRSHPAIAAAYQISVGTVENIKYLRTWRHI